MKKSVPLTAVAVAFLFAQQAFAGYWVSEAKVKRIVVKDSGTFDIWFDKDVTDSACTYKDRITVDSASVSSLEARDRIMQIALAAKLSGGMVEVATRGGCAGSSGKYEFIGLK